MVEVFVAVTPFLEDNPLYGMLATGLHALDLLNVQIMVWGLEGTQS